MKGIGFTKSQVEIDFESYSIGEFLDWTGANYKKQAVAVDNCEVINILWLKYKGVKSVILSHG